MKLAITVAVLVCLAAVGQALDCYACKGTASDLLSGGGKLPTEPKSCKEFKEEDAFKMTCPNTHNKSCLKVDVEGDVMRGCSAEEVDKCNEGKNKHCCSGDKCNGSSRGWPSAVLLLSAVAAAVLGGRR